jgi:hypothetical protein
VRINANLAMVHENGVHVEHWLCPIESTVTGEKLNRHLRQLEEHLIREWGLRSVGWNRG